MVEGLQVLQNVHLLLGLVVKRFQVSYDADFLLGWRIDLIRLLMLDFDRAHTADQGALRL